MGCNNTKEKQKRQNLTKNETLKRNQVFSFIKKKLSKSVLKSFVPVRTRSRLSKMFKTERKVQSACSNHSNFENDFLESGFYLFFTFKNDFLKMKRSFLRLLWKTRRAKNRLKVLSRLPKVRLRVRKIQNFQI